MASLHPIPLLRDLQITFKTSSLIHPSQKTQRQSIFLSNMDQLPNYNIPTAHFFMPNQDFPPEIVAERLKIGLEKVLVAYDFMAGRLKLNSKIGRLEIDCNDAGAGFVVASSEISLEEMRKYLDHPNLGYRQLAVEKLDHLPAEVGQPLCVFQLTSFKCGGFAMGMSMNHILFDGIGAKVFLENLASQSFNEDKPLSSIPCNNRRLLAARSPPQVSFPHPEILDLNLPLGEGSSPPVFDCNREELECTIFKFSLNNIAELKKKSKTTTISTLTAVSAVIWRCKAFSGEKQPEKTDVSSLLGVVDVRARVDPPLPPSYSGNAILAVRVSATVEELENELFSTVAGKIGEAAKVVMDEYVRSTLDWSELHRGVPHGDYMVSSWLGLGFEQIVYPWGKPFYCCPVVNHRKDICWVFRDGIDGGVAAMVALPAEEMERFENHFRSMFI